MNIELSGPVILYASIIFLAFFSAIILFFKKENRRSNRILSLLLICIALWILDAFLNVSGIYLQDPDFYFKPIYYSFAFGPLIYFYVRSLTNSSFLFRKIHFLHFFPVLLQAGLYLFLNFQDYTFKRTYWLDVHKPFTYRIEFDGTFISLAIYLVFSILLLNRYQKWLNEQYSESSKMQLNWLRAILFVLLLLCIQWFIEVILRDFYDNYYQYNFSIIILGILTLILAFGSLLQSNLSQVHFNSEISIESKSNIKPDIQKGILDKIVFAMTDQKAYLDPKLSLKDFAGQLNIPSRLVSEHINHGLNKNFTDFVNEYRVREFKNNLDLQSNKHLTLEALAYECGFNSKASFNRIFKKFTGKTPSQYIKS